MSNRCLRAARRFAVSLTLFTAARAMAAPITSADPAGLCNGQVPCFTTLSAALANAGPPPATVFVFPGTYAESIDLGLMGSGIGGGPGELAVISVDAAGQPAPGAVVDPAALGGPGTGYAVRAIGFPAAVTIDGLVLRSPDSDGLNMASGLGSVHLRNLVASGNLGGQGISVAFDDTSPAEITAEAIRTDGNGDTGMLLHAARVVATDVTAGNNGGRGFELRGNQVVGQGMRAEVNVNEGVFVHLVNGVATFALDDITVRSNGDTGLLVITGSSAVSTTGTLASVVAEDHIGDGILVSVYTLTATNLTANQNGTGMSLFALDQLTATGLSAVGNGSFGISLASEQAHLSSSSAQDNRTGIILGGENVVLEDCTASGSGPAGPELIHGAGFVIAATVLDAAGNSATGNVVGWFFDDETEVPERPALAAAIAGPGLRPRAPGGALPDQRLALQRIVTAGNAAASMRVRLRDQGQLAVSCSDFVDNGDGGFEQLTNHVVEARTNFWGSVTGPTHPLNPGGSGDIVRDSANGGSGTVVYADFLDAPATDEDCVTAGVVEVPALGPIGLGLLAMALAAAALLRLGR